MSEQFGGHGGRGVVVVGKGVRKLFEHQIYLGSKRVKGYTCFCYSLALSYV